jgi:sugar phosphate isomerase/epimerase
MKLEDFGMDTITLPGPLEAKLAAIREAGFTQAMLSASDLASHPGGEAAAFRAVRDSGLRVTGLQVLRDFEGLSGRLHEYKVDVAKSMLEMAQAVGAPLLLVCSTTSAHAVDDFEAQVADLRKLAMLAVPLGIRIAFEGLSWGRFIDDVRGAWAAVSAADRANLGLAIDSFHMLAKETPLDALEEIDPDKLFFVQLSDFMWSAPSTPEERRETARHLRVFPGEGAHSEELAALIRALDRLGYDGDYSFEVFNDDYVQMQATRVALRARCSVEWITSHVSRRSLPVRRNTQPVVARADWTTLRASRFGPDSPSGR